jgi:drug/metabolite transporter (DMT)-like permease
MTQRGHTGIEGNSVKVCGILAGVIGLIWVVLSYFIQDLTSALVLPILLLVAGVITFLVGRSMAKAHAGSGG